jgi:hypothetical protein
MLTALEQVLQSQYATTLTNEFPKFTWHNYFMNSGTYDIQVTNVYTDTTTLPPAFTGPQWQLFREGLFYPRNDWNGVDPRSNGIPNAGVFVDRPVQYPWIGPSSRYSRWISSLGAGYFEFLGGAMVAPGSTLLVTLENNLSPEQSNLYSRVSVLPIRDFLDQVKPQNQFLTPTMGSQGPSSSRYTFRVANFDRCGRVTVIVNNVGTANQYLYRVNAEVFVPTPGTPLPPCTLQLP